ncbi:hypothetical protein V8F33_011625 [Rhypophila sp. PSN 637]
MLTLLTEIIPSYPCAFVLTISCCVRSVAAGGHKMCPGPWSINLVAAIYESVGGGNARSFGSLIRAKISSLYENIGRRKATRGKEWQLNRGWF